MEDFEMFLQSVAQDLREQGCDEQFIQCCLEDLREGADVTVITNAHDTLRRDSVVITETRDAPRRKRRRRHER